jgi:hypothetical protein
MSALNQAAVPLSRILAAIQAVKPSRNCTTTTDLITRKLEHLERAVIRELVLIRDAQEAQERISRMEAAPCFYC